MAASDWDADPTNNADILFPDIGGGDHAMLISCYPDSGAEHAYFFQKTNINMKNTELDVKFNTVDTELLYYLMTWFRWDRGQAAGANGYVFILTKGFSYPHFWVKMLIQKMVNGTPTTLFHSGNLQQWNLNFWRQVRLRCWDLVFPAGAVRFSFERWTGTAWELLCTYTDVTGAFYNTYGRVGFGNAGGTGVTNQRCYVNDLYLRW